MKIIIVWIIRNGTIIDGTGKPVTWMLAYWAMP